MLIIVLIIGIKFSSIIASAQDFGWTKSGAAYTSDSGLMNYSVTPSGWSHMVNIYRSVPAKVGTTSIKKQHGSYSLSKSGISIITNGDQTIQHGYIILPIEKNDIQSSRVGHLYLTDMSNTEWVFDAELSDIREVVGCELNRKGKRGLPELISCENKLVVDLGEGRTVERLETLVTVRSPKNSCRVPLKSLMQIKSGESELRYKNIANIQSELIKANSSCKALFDSSFSSQPGRAKSGAK